MSQRNLRGWRQSGAIPNPIQPRIAVCVCTFRRPRMLAEWLRKLFENLFGPSHVEFSSEEEMQAFAASRPDLRLRRRESENPNHIYAVARWRLFLADLSGGRCPEFYKTTLGN